MRVGPEAICFYGIFCLLLRYYNLPDIPADGIGNILSNIYIYIYIRNRYLYIYIYLNKYISDFGMIINDIYLLYLSEYLIISI